MPIGATVHVTLRGHPFAELRGRLEVARAPDLPFTAAAPLHLRISGIEFTRRQLENWSLD